MVRTRPSPALLVAVLCLLPLGCGKPPPPPLPPPKVEPVAEAKPRPVRQIPKARTDEPSAECAARDKQLADLLAPYVDAFGNRGIEVSPDGKSLLFLSNRGGGSYQLYVAPLDKPAAPPTAIAAGKDEVTDARFSPDGLYVLFTRDKDKNENTQIFRASADGKEVVPLTKAATRWHALPRASSDWKTLVYFRGLHKTGGTTLVTQPLEGGEAKKVLTAKGFHVLTDISPDGKHALVFKLLSLSRSRLWRVDLASGQKTVIAPTPKATAHAHQSAYSADGKSIYVVTDEGSERAALRKVDGASLKVQATFADPAAEVADLAVSKKQPLVAVLLDFGSHQALKLLDGETLKEKAKVKLPLGRIGLGQFTTDGAGLVITLSTPAAPGDVFLVNAQNGKLKPLRRDVRPGLRKLAAVVAKVERVASFDKLAVPLNVYLPKRVPRGKKLPTIVSVHGGPAASSAIGWSPLIGFWISRGFAVVEPNVRGSTGFGKEYEKADNGPKRMDAVKDLAAVNEWVRQQPWADPERLVVFGGSYGGYMTYMGLGHQPDKWRAGIGLVGVVNLQTFLRTTTGAIRLAFREEFGDLEKDGPFLKTVSPITVVRQIKAPLFVYQGENDPRVPRSEQDQLVTALRKRQVPVEYMVAADEGHSVAQRHNKLAFFARAVRFLEQHLGLPGLPAGCAAPAAPGNAKSAAKPAAPGGAAPGDPAAKK